MQKTVRLASRTALAVAILIGSISGVRGQATTNEMSGRAASDVDRYVVRFATRSFDLRAFRAAVQRRAPHAQVARIVAGLEVAVRRDQAEFVTQVRGLGGRVAAQWWIVNGCSIEIPRHRLDAVRALPGVSQVDADRPRRPHLADATNSSHHGSDQANKIKDKAGRWIVGSGVSVAVLDTGADAESGTTRRPHRAHYPGGNPSNNKNGGIGGSLLLAATKVPQVNFTEDISGHGTAVAGCVAANRWNSLTGVDNAVAPGAGIVSVNIANSGGITLDSWIVSGWQLVASLRMKHEIGVGINAYSGSPSLKNIAQQALDSAAYNADIVVLVSAGNRGSNTTESQHAYNGLAVGSVDKTVLTKSKFSATGPLSGSKRTYPDITAVGKDVVTVLRDDEASKAVHSGTSFAAPLVAGAAALCRQANPKLSAVETKAMLLNTVAFRTSDRNAYGIGFMKADAAVRAALASDVVSGHVTGKRKVANFHFKPTTTVQKCVTVAWMRRDFVSTIPVPPDLELRIFDDNDNLVAKDLNPENAYEHVRFDAKTGTTYRAEVTWRNPPANAEPLEFAIAGMTDYAAPTLSKATPTAFHSYDPGTVEITGQALATVTAVGVDGQNVTEFSVMDDTTIRFTPPNLLPIGNAKITVTNPAGTSNAVDVAVTGRARPVMAGATTVVRGSDQYEYGVYSDKNWLSLLSVSTSDKPSKALPYYDLGIGNGFTELIPLLYLNQDRSGAATVRFAYPTSIPSLKIHFQALSIDPAGPKLPFPASNVLSVQIQ